MKAKKLYERLDKDFILPGLSDSWDEMKPYSKYVCDNFKERQMGLLCDNSSEINEVFTAVFPSEEVMSEIVKRDVTDALLFVHHPMIWDLNRAPEIFYNMDEELLEEFKLRRISIYVLHVPLDSYSQVSTSNSLGMVLGVSFEKVFARYFGGMCGVMGSVDLKSVLDLKKRFSEVVGHKVSLYDYGDDEIENGRVAIVAGGGNDVEILEEVAGEGINVMITGITALNDYSKPAHDFAKEKGINVLGGTHYSTEKFACMNMVGYFDELGLKAEFLEDEPVLEDL